MESILRRDLLSRPVLADLTAAQGCDNELSRLESETDSSSNVENSVVRLHQIENSTKDCLTAWTNEKHDLYLDHLESSFVEQLHRSTGVLAWCSEHDSRGPYLSQKLHAKTRNTSDQLKVIQDCCLENIDLKRSQHMLNHATGSLVVLKSHPRCASRRHFVRPGKPHDNSAARNLCTGGKKIIFNEAGITSEQISARHDKSLDCIEEFSDQNFADEASEQKFITTMSKRSKNINPEV